MNTETETPVTPALTLTALAELFESTVWQAKRVYIKGYSVDVYLTLDSDGDVHVTIGRGLSGKKWDAIFASVERRMNAAFGERTLYT